MRKVIDTSQLKSENLRQYLEASTKNFAVIPDYVSMEAYKGDALVTIMESMDILRWYPGQVIVLKGTRDVSRLRGRLAGLQRRMIDTDQTTGFKTFLEMLKLAPEGNVEVQRQILENGRAAAKHIDGLLLTASAIASVIAPLVEDFSKEDRAEIQSWRITSQHVIRTILNAVVDISTQVFRLLPYSVKPPSIEELPNTFVFRAVLCCYLMVIERGAYGGGAPQLKVSSAKVRNDMVDMYIAAYATFFDGILSGDAKLNRIHFNARMILEELFKR